RPLYAFDRIWITSDLFDSMMVFDPRTQGVVGVFEIDTNPSQAYEVLGKVWVSTTGRTISVIDPVTLSVESIDTGSPSVDFAPSSGAVWVANFEADTVTVYDPDSLSVIATVQVGDGPADVISVGDEVWIVNYLSNDISVIDAASFTVVDNIPTDAGTVATVANGEVWLLGRFGLSVVDPTTRSVSTVDVPGIDFVLWMVAVGDELWFASFEGAIVLDAPSRTTTEVSLGEPAWTRPAVDAETVWLATQSGDLVGLDRETLSVVARIPVGTENSLTGFIALSTPTVAADGIWIADANEDSIKVVESGGWSPQNRRDHLPSAGHVLSRTLSLARRYERSRQHAGNKNKEMDCGYDLGCGDVLGDDRSVSGTTRSRRDDGIYSDTSVV
ncbi:MAG: YncE family protein, partial [Acidimicrobiales bacterium]